jgi:hypothetical protein
MWTVVPHVYNVITAPHIQSWIFDWTYLRCCWRYAYICMHVILQILCQIQSPTSGLRYVNCGPGHIQCIYSSAYSDFNVHLNVSALLLDIFRQFNSRYTANLVPNTAHILRFTLCELWSRTYTMHLQLHIFRFQYSFERISAAIVHITTIRVILQTWCQIQRTSSSLRCVDCSPGRIQSIYSSAYLSFNIQLQVSAAAIVDITTIQCALYCKLVANYSAHSPVYAMWTVVPAIYKILIALHI